MPITNTSSTSLPISTPNPLPVTLVTPRSLIKRQHISPASRSAHNSVLPRCLSLFPAWEIGFFAGHETARVEDVEEDESEEHESGVEDVLVGFVAGDAAVDALGVFDEAEYYTDLVE